MEYNEVYDDNWNKIAEAKKKKPYTSITKDAGDIDYNIKMFNQRWGDIVFDHSYLNGTIDSGSTDSLGSAGTSADASAEGGFGESVINEAKDRTIRRYYIRPQNVYCSTKKDILRTLVKSEDQNCTVYSLKNLNDKNEVSKLTTGDILYYYDDRVLYDKNHVQVIDYNLSIGKEEKRKKYTGEIDQVPEAELKKTYDDRLIEPLADTDVDEALNQDFAFVNARGQELTEDGEPLEYTCCICGQDCEGYGNNPEPYMPAYDKEGNRQYCCQSCNLHFVIPARLEQANVDNNSKEKVAESKNSCYNNKKVEK